MSEFPAGPLLGSMLSLAAIALLLTFIALAHDKKLASAGGVFKQFVKDPGSQFKGYSSQETSLFSRGDKKKQDDKKRRNTNDAKRRWVFSSKSIFDPEKGNSKGSG